MSAHFIRLDFGADWLLIAWLFIGAPLVFLLMGVRAYLDPAQPRKFAIATMVILLIGSQVVLMQFSDIGNEDTNELILIGLSAVAAVSWLASAIKAPRFRGWPDIVVLSAPTLLGLWAWSME